MKRFFITFLISVIIVSLIHILVYRFKLTYRSASDALFIVGLFMFFGSFTVVSGASRIFITMGYSFKSFIGRQHTKHANLYDYTQSRVKENQSPYAVSILLIGLIYVIMSFVLASM